MAFVKNDVIIVGDTIILNREITTLAGTFEIGTEVVVTGSSERGYDIKDNEGNVAYECGWDIGTKKFNIL